MMTGTRTHLVARLSLVVLLASSATIGAATLSSASPSREEVEQAQARLDTLNQELDQMVEQYNQARIRLQEVQARLADVRSQAQQAQATADRATNSLNANASRAYRGVGSQIAELFDSASLADFSDRLEFIGSMAQADSDLAVEAETAQQEARWTAAELAATAEERQGIVDSLASKQDQIESRVAEARALFQELDRKYHDALAAQAAAAQDAAGSGSSTDGGGAPIPPPPAPNGNVAAVLAAAYSVHRHPYQYGGSSPETGSTARGSRCGPGRMLACTSRIRRPRSTRRSPTSPSRICSRATWCSSTAPSRTWGSTWGAAA
jgi:peptidoglycan hydrolase CwlO-like protein